MDNELLLVSNGSTFMVDALNNGLKESGIETALAKPQINELKKYSDRRSVILFYLGNYLDEIRDVLVYLKDMLTENDGILCTIGNEEEYEVLTETVPQSLITHHFSRPLNIKEVAEEMQKILSQNDEKSRRKKLLLVDDDAAFLTMMKSWLDEKYNVVIVTSGMQAITYLANNTPDLILLDYEMPVTPGPKVLEMIRSEYQTASIPVFFLTGKGDKESVTSVLALKPEGYILKGIDRKALLDQIETFFGKDRRQ